MDMINDLVHEDGPKGRHGFGLEARRTGVIGKIAEALEKARAAGIIELFPPPQCANFFVNSGYAPN